MQKDLFNSRAKLKTSHGDYTIFSLSALQNAGLANLAKLPYSIRVMLEAALRQCNGNEITE